MRLLRSSFALVTLGLGGCALPVKHADGSRTYLVVGLGWIQEPAPASADTEAVRIQALGLALAKGPQTQAVLGLGRIQSVGTAMPPGGVLIHNSDQTLTLVPAPPAPATSTP